MFSINDYSVYCFSLGRLFEYQHYEFLCVEKFFHLLKTNKQTKNKAFAEEGVRELVQENDANFYLAISLSKLPPKHYSPPGLCCCSDSKQIRTQQLKVFFYNCSASPSQGATGRNSGLLPHGYPTIPTFTTFQRSLSNSLFI